MRPADDPIESASWSVTGTGRRFDQVGAAVFDVAGGSELRDDEISVVVVDEVALAVFNEVGSAPASLRRHVCAHPESLPCSGIQPAQFAITADSVNVIIDNERRCDHRVQTIGLVR